MLQEIEELIMKALKQFMEKPELIVAELQAIYSMYRDLKVVVHGQANDQNAK